MIRYLIRKDNKYFLSFITSYNSKGRSVLIPQFGLISRALMFHSKNDALRTAERFDGDVFEIKKELEK